MMVVNAEAHRSFEFGPFHLDLSERLLLRNGKAVPLAPKVFDTLSILVENSGHILEKDELMTKLWPDTFVEESSLSQNIFQLRKVLAEDTPDLQYIETIPKRGYRFSADVTEIMRDDDVAASPYLTNARSLIKEDETSLTVKSLAVLPFKPLGKEKADEYLGLGMADATIIKLSGLRQLLVLPTSTVIRYTGRRNNTLTLGRKLNVDAILDGTVQHADDRVRVTVQLICLESGKTIWSGKFDEHFTDIFAVQDSISEQVAGALALRITGTERKRLRKRHTENTEAYQMYLMGLFFWKKRTKDGLIKAVAYFQQAIKEDPSYALAYALLADSYFWIAYSEVDTATRKERFEQSRSNALKALELDPFVAEAHAVLGTVKVKHDRDPAGAEKSFERAIALNPNCAMAHARYTLFLAAMGRLNESLQKVRRAQELDPVSPDANASLANVLYLARNYDEAIRYCERALALEPNFLDALVLLGLSYEQKGMLPEAIDQFRKAKDANAESTEPLELLAHTCAISGQKDEARALLTELQSSRKPNSLHPYHVALIYAALNQKDQAFEWLAKPYANWTERLRMLRFDPRMDSLKADSRFAAIVQRSTSLVLAD
jgi:DNA-binding winged helix-turn-helix (wHTH) protein/tetratricopeptide (TPR) repeat protein